MGVRHTSLLVLSLLLFSMTVSADSTAKLTESCVLLCNDKDYDAAIKCFKKDRDEPAAYLATATCAYNNYDDSAAEEFAITAAKKKHEWATFINKFGYTVIRTGGLGETYALAHVASGGTRHHSTALRYLRTSGQCKDVEDSEACAEQYLASVVSRYSSRNIQEARVTHGGVMPEFTGRIVDAEGHPIKRAKVTLIVGSREASGVLDDEGRYTFSLDDLRVTDPNQLAKEGKLFVKLQYHEPAKGDEVQFVYLWNNKPVYFFKKFTINGLEDLQQHFVLNASRPLTNYGGLPSNPAYLEHFGVSYYEMTRVYEYYRDVLRVDMKYKMPIQIILFATGTETYFTPAHRNSKIVIARTDSKRTDSDRPKNREWHEFNHFIMFNNYGKWPQPPSNSTVKEINHAGYSNPNTADSYTEGFAEFMSLMIARHYGEPDWKVYAAWGNLDKPIKPWQKYGREEELAVAATLLDLVDPKDDDPVEIPFTELWNIIKDYRQNNYVVYTAVRQKYPDIAADIDKVYITNGFFNDKTRGDGTWQAKESWHDVNGNNVVDRNELKIDYANEPGLGRPWMLHQEGEEPGYAANYERPKRENAGKTPGQFIKVTNTVPHYRIVAVFHDTPEYNYETTTDNDDGMIFVGIPNWESDATLTVTPIGVAYDNPLTFTTQEFDAMGNTPLEQGYFVEHDFQVQTALAPPTPLEPQHVDTEPYWETKNLVATPEEYVYRGFTDTPLRTERMFSWTWMLIVVLVALLSLLFVWRRRR